jgi:hypothetical protein
MDVLGYLEAVARVRAAAAPLAAPPALRVTFSLLERYAPGVGARWAERLWFTLPRLGSRLLPWPELGDRFPGRPFEVAVDDSCRSLMARRSRDPAVLAEVVDFVVDGRSRDDLA